MDVIDNQAYGVSINTKKRLLPTSENMYELVDPSGDNKKKCDGELEITRAVQEEPKTTNTCKASLLIGIALFTAVLALLLAMVSVGLSMALNSSKTEVESLAKQQVVEMMMNFEQISQNQRAVYTRWGNSSCPNINGTTLVYTGVVGGTGFPKQGGGSNHLCMPLEPEYTLPYQPGVQARSLVFPSEYETAYLGSIQQNVPCAVCSVSTRTQALMIPAKTSCPTDWTREYYGYLMSEAVFNYRSSFICVDSSHEPIPNTGNHTEASDLYQTEAHCSLYQCPPYDAEKELECVVCSQ